MCNDIACPYCNYKYEGRKQLVLVCAGQSNSVGYAENYTYTVPNAEGLFQLGLYGGENLKVIPLTTTPQNFQNLSSKTLDSKYPANASIKTDKTSYHLQLAYRLREAMNENYDVLIIPIAFGMTGFTTTKNATLDTCALTHKETAAQYSWKAGLIFSQILVERIKFAMRLNPENIFGGIVWFQGENDSTNDAGVSTFKIEFPKLIDYVAEQLADLKDKSINMKSVGKEIWYTPTSTLYWYNSYKFEQIYNVYQETLPKENLISLPFDEQYTNANNGDGQTSSQRNSHFRDMVLVGNLMANTMLQNDNFELPYKIPVNYKNNKNDYSSFVDNFITKGAVRLTINNIGDIMCNPAPKTATQVALWFNKEVRGFLIDNAQTPGDVYMLIKNKDGKDYAFLISSAPDANNRYWQFYKYENNTLTQIAVNNTDNTFNVFSVLRYSDGQTPNFNSTKQAIYGLSMNQYGNLLVINGEKSSNMIVKDSNRMILANDYCYTPIGTENIEVVDSTLFSSSDLQRIGQFEKQTTNEAIDLRLIPIQFGLLVNSPVNASSNATKLGHLAILSTDASTRNYF